MKRMTLRIGWLLACLLIAGIPGWTMEGLKQKSPARPLRLIVRFKSSYLSTVESGASATLKTFMKNRRIKQLDPVFKDFVNKKKRTGKSANDLARDLQARYPERSRRYRGKFAPPDLSKDYVITPETETQASLDQLVSTLKQDPQVESVQQENVFHAQFVPNDPYYSSFGSWGQSYGDLWGLQKIQSAPAWDVSQGSGVIVAVVDSGIDYTHPDLAANVWTNPSDGSHGFNFVSNTNDPFDDHGHGTHVAGTIAAVGNNSLGVIGVAPKARVMGVKGLDAGGNGYTPILASGVIWAADHGAQVINMSWGGTTFDLTLDSALQYAYMHGVVLVAAAGNNASDASGFYPASSPYVITVSASDPNDLLAYFSNFGTKIDVAAPGVDTLSLQAAGTALGSILTPGYIRLDGTSMATPHVSGLAADILSKFPSYSNEQVRSAIRSSADDIGVPGFDASFGYGRINAAKALNYSSGLVAKIQSPAGGALLSTPISITGIASANTGFSSYSLEYALSAGTPTWTQIKQGSAPVTNGFLGQLDPRPLADGTYRLRLTVRDTAGKMAVDEIMVIIRFSFITDPVSPTYTDGATTYKPGMVVNVTGSAGTLNFQHYRVEWAPGINPTAGWSTAGILLTNGGLSPVTNGSLATWATPTSALENYYTIRMVVDGPTLTTTVKTLVFLQPALTTTHWPQVVNNQRTLFNSPYPMRDASLQTRLAFSGSTDFWLFKPDGTFLSNSSYGLYGSGSPPAVGPFEGTPGDEALIGNDRSILKIRPDGSQTPLYTDSTYSTAYADPVMADLQGNGRLETVFVTSYFGMANATYLHALTASGTELTPNFPISLPDLNINQLGNGNRILVADLNRDGKKEIVMAYGDTPSSFALKVFNWDGTPYAFASPTFSNSTAQILASADLNNNGQMQLIVVTNSNFNGAKTVFVLASNGSVLPGWPVVVTPQSTYIGFLALGDLDKDGKKELILSAGTALHVMRSNGQPYSSYWPHDEGVNHYFGPIVIGDADGDGFPDIFVDKEDSTPDNWNIVASQATPVNPSALIQNKVATAFAAHSTASQAPMFEDFHLNAYHRNGALLKSWRLNGTQGKSHYFMQSFTLGDTDQDGLLDAVIGDEIYDPLAKKYLGTFEMYNLNVPYSAATTPWPMQYHDPQNTSTIASSLPADVTPPTAPRALVVSTVTTSSFFLTWTAATDNVAVAGYKLDLSTNAFASFVPGFAGYDIGLTTQMVVPSLIPNTTYFTRLQAYDAVGNLSPYSGTAFIHTLPDTLPPAVPSPVFMYGASSSTIYMTWGPSFDNVLLSGYRVDVSTSPAFDSFVPGYANGDVGLQTSITITNLKPAMTYFGRLRAYDNAGNISPNSMVASLATLSVPVADLVITQMIVTPAVVMPGGSYRIDVTLLNQNVGAATSNINVQIMLDTQGSAGWGANVPTLGPYQSWQHSFFGNAPLGERLHALHAVIATASLESDTTNNDIYSFFTVTISSSTDTYLSDLPWVSASTGSIVKRDRSVGDQGLRLNGKTYAKGLGMASNTDVVFPLPLGQQCALFSFTGIDDEVGANGSIIASAATNFGIYGSGLLMGGQPAQSVGVDVSNNSRLTLHVGDAGDGNLNDHADWADARLHCNLVNDTHGPVISNVTLTNVTTGSALITWDTDELSNSTIGAGPTPALGFTYADWQSLQHHSLGMFGLQPATTYYYRVSSADSFSNTGFSAIQSFKTLPLSGGRMNVALITNGATASASSNYSSGLYPAASAITGNKSGSGWGSGTGGWNDDTSGAYPDWLQVTFAGAKNITEVDVYTVQDSPSAPISPTPTLTFSKFGLTNFDVQYYNGSSWVIVPGGHITGNQLVWRQLTFPAISTGKIRVFVNGSLGSYSRITDIEAYESSVISAPTITSSATASGQAGSPFIYQIVATNSPTFFNATGLPAGLVVSTQTGAISGTPATVGASTVTLSATNSGGTGIKQLNLIIQSGGRVNVALNTNGATASASSNYSSGLYPAASAITGNKSGSGWGSGTGGWNDDTSGAYPDWLQVTFAGAKNITEVDVYTVQDSPSAPISPTPTLTFSKFGLTNFDVQYYNGSSWVIVPGGHITGNQLVWRQLTFPAISTGKIRVFVNGSLGSYSRITDIEAYESSAIMSSTAPATFTPIRLVSGRTTSYTDTAGRFWAADNNANGGSSDHTSHAITNTIDPALYQNSRVGDFTYAFAVPNGFYTVNLKFADIYFNTIGSRLFNVSINGQVVLSNFDIVAAAGSGFRAVDRPFPVSATGGQITIQFMHLKDQASISAIEIVQQGQLLSSVINTEATPLAAPSPFDALRVYPNPWRGDRDSARDITFDQMPPGSQIKVFTVSGRWVITLTGDAGGRAFWNRRDASGNAVASGIYFYLGTDGQGGQGRGKFVIIK